MSRSSQRPKKDKVPSIGKTPTLHSFFGSTSQSTSMRAPPKPTEIIDIGSDDENIKTSPTQAKRKAPGDSDCQSLSFDTKKSKVSRNTTKSTINDGSPLKPVPLSSLNCTITAVEFCLQANQTQEMINLVGDWEMGDDELLDIVDDSQVVDDDASPENALDTCPVCGAIFVDLCLSVSATPSPLFMVHVHATSFSNYKRTCMLVLRAYR